MLIKSLILFSVGLSCVPSLLFTWGQTMVEVMQKCPTQCPQPFSRPPLTHTLCWRLLDTAGQVWVSLLWVMLLSPESWCTQNFVCALQESVSPVLCKFWRLYGGVNGDLLQEGLCHTQDGCTQSPCPVAGTSAGDTLTQFWLSLWVLVHTSFV